MSATRVGILGGGQLALMLAEALVALGCDLAIYDPDPEAPARRRFGGASAAYEDRAALKAFLDGCDVVTYEFENVPASAIRAAGSRTQILPSLDVLETCQHRVREKQALVAAGAPTVAFMPVADRDALPAALRAFGYPCVVKTAAGGYDGKGQRTYRREQDVRADDFAAGVELVVEERVELELEMSCIVARTPREAVCLPVLENVHTAHILDVTLCPARVSPAIARRAEALALRVAEALDVHGLLTVEMFVARGRKGHGVKLAGTDARLYVNELAPRPHNSGHVSRIACDWSQFALHARAVLRMPLPQPVRTTREVAFMANLMGDRWPTADHASATFGALSARPGVREVYVYGKASARPGRKMGHVSGVAGTHAKALEKVTALRRGARLSGPRRVR